MIAAAVLVAGATAPAYAAFDPTTDAPKPASAAKVEKAKVYCVSASHTGSRMQKKTCRTREDWIARDGFDPLAPAR
ncbi:hypothetical protein MZO42_01435 [Sphingomonas psychrotolerans]|uniref:Uncharacterized protein n=1 Tax=Sphingomonas psychrotolerans TaxID=1327635 RepID=A0ABU3MYF7_9SPHN|nr:hypothetical protein [Sphingomonas psychrotolerans]MDT8757349.1 hypothetical protein [Sphingomonas psychrotolerans]